MKELAQALVKAQSKFQAAKKSTTNPFHKSKYADLESVWEAVQQPLAEEGLAISQTFRHEGDSIYLITHLIHTSGEMFTSEIPIVAIKKDPQGYGSAITYFRRYSLQSILCLVTSDDDDGERASGRGGLKPAKEQIHTIPQAAAGNSQKNRDDIVKFLTSKWLGQDLVDLSGDLFQISNSAELTLEQLNRLAEIVSKYNNYSEWVKEVAEQSLT